MNFNCLMACCLTHLKLASLISVPIFEYHEIVANLSIIHIASLESLVEHDDFLMFEIFLLARK